MAELQSHTDPLLILISRVSEMQLEQGKTLHQQTKDQHEIGRLLAVLNTRLEPLVSMSADFSALRLQVHEHQGCIGIHTRAIEALETDVETLKTSSATRSGWEGTLGTLGKILLGAILAFAASMMIPKASAAPATPMKVTPHYEHPCWSVPAPNNKHQWLLV